MTDRTDENARDQDLSPEELHDLRASEPLTTAAGFRAIRETTTHTFSKMSPVRATRALLKMNQKDGFDCPSCAWPDPDGKRTIAEFCESGAKALADEAMSGHLPATF